MIPLSQRDLRWSRQQLGTSNTTIGSHGCTITCIAMLVGTTPDVVNKELKRIGGFANGNLVIWSKVPTAFPQLTFVKRVNSYNNSDVLANLPCLVEVDFDGSPVTFGNHWVVFIGNKRLLDPWVGQERATSVYPILKGYAVFKKKVDESVIIPVTEPAPVSNTTPQETPEIVTSPPEPPADTPTDIPPDNTTESIPTNGSNTPNIVVESDPGDVPVGDSTDPTTGGPYTGTGSPTNNEKVVVEDKPNALVQLISLILKKLFFWFR